MTDASDLIERLERGELGGMDAEIAAHVGIRHQPRRTKDGKSKGRQWLVDSHGGIETWANHPPPFTTSLDAARSLSDWVLIYASDIGADGLAMVKLGDPGRSPSPEVVGIHASLEIAWCIAALRAAEKVTP